MRAVAASCVPLIPWIEVVALGSGGAEEFAGKAQGGLPCIFVCAELVQQHGRARLGFGTLGLLAASLMALQAGPAG